MTIALSAHRISLDYRREDIDSMTSQMENLEQAEAKSSFCYAQNTLLLFAEGHELSSRKAILDNLGSLDKWSERAMETMSTLSDLYLKNSQLEKSYTIVDKIEWLEEDYYKASEVAWYYLNLLRSSKSPGLSQRTQKTGTSLTVGMFKQCDDIQTHTQTKQCTNIEQKEHQYRAFSVKWGSNETSRQWDTTAHISTALNRTESKLSDNIEADWITSELTCTAEDEITSCTEGKRGKYQGRSAGKESRKLTAHKNDNRISAEHTKSVQLAIYHVIRESDNYNICQYKSSKVSKSYQRLKSRKKFTFSKCSKFRKRPKSLKPYQSRKRPKSRKKPKSRKRSKFSMSSKPKKRLKSRMDCKSRKRFWSKKKAKSKRRYRSKI